MKKIISPTEVWANVIAPPSKSIAIRALATSILTLIHSAIETQNVGKQIIIHNYPTCDDAITALKIAEQLELEVNLSENNILTLGFNLNSTPSNPKIINCEQSALCYRMFPFIASLIDGEYNFLAEGSLKKRNNEQLINIIKTLEISNSSGNTTNFDFVINNILQAGNYEIDCSNSSQELSGLLIALPMCSEDSQITANHLYSAEYIDLTIDVLKQFGIEIYKKENNAKHIFKIAGNQKYKKNEFAVEGDWSGIANFFVLGAIAGEVTVANANKNSKQPDSAIYQIFQNLNINCEEIGESIIRIRKSEYSGFEFDATNCPDLIPPLVVLALNAKSNSRIIGIDRLVNKESNRKDILMKVFSLFGAKIKSEKNCFTIAPSKISGGFADSYNDHRIAMAIAIVAKIAKMPVTLTNAEVVNKSFPEFWKYF